MEIKEFRPLEVAIIRRGGKTTRKIVKTQVALDKVLAKVEENDDEVRVRDAD